MNTYDLEALLEIENQIDKNKTIPLTDEALTRILGLLNDDYSQRRDQLYLKTNAVEEGQNAYIPMHMKVDRKVTDADSLQVKQQEAQRAFNRLNRSNAPSIASEMKKLVGNNDISEIFIKALALYDDKIEQLDVWEYWIKLLPELNKGTNNEFRNVIVKDTKKRFDSLCTKKEECMSYQIIGCWLSCLLVVDFITSKEYINFMHKIIKLDFLKINDVVSAVQSSLYISGKKIDNERNPLTDCWFLFSFLQMMLKEHFTKYSFLKIKILDLFELREVGWNHEEYKKKFESETKQTSSTYVPPGKTSSRATSWSDFSKNYNQQEFWENEYTKFKYHPQNYKIPGNISESNQSIIRTLLSLSIKKKGNEINDFLKFAGIALNSIFKNNINELKSAMVKAKKEFRELFKGDEIVIINENHTRFYNLIANYLSNYDDELYNYTNTLFDIYLHIDDLSKNDEILSPVPSVFIDSIFKFLDSDEYFTPDQCNTLLSKFPNKPEDFNKLVFRDQYTENTKKVKPDDFWPFLSQLVSSTNTDLIENYFEKKEEINQYSFYDRLLFFYDKCYSFTVNDDELDRKRLITEAVQFVFVGVDEYKEIIVKNSLELLREYVTDEKVISDLSDFIMKDA